jgi:hypothetical protein
MREHHRDVIAFLQGAGAERPRITRERRQRHPRVTFTVGGVEHSMPISGTPRDRMLSTRRAIAQLKRLIRSKT